MELKNLKCVTDNINFDEYINHMNIVKSTMEHPEWLGDLTKEDIEYLVSHGSKIFMYYDNNDFICSMMFIPADKKSLDKFNIDKDYKIVGECGPIFVYDKYRGNHLQSQMIKELDKYSINNNYKYLVTTVHPDNIYCIKNFISNDYKLLDSIDLKRGIRNIYFKEL